MCIGLFLFWSLYKTNRFHVAVGLFINRSQRTSKCGKNNSDTLACGSCATSLFLRHFDVICDLLLTDARQHGIYLLNWEVSDFMLFWDNTDIWKVVKHFSSFLLKQSIEQICYHYQAGIMKPSYHFKKVYLTWTEKILILKNICIVLKLWNIQKHFTLIKLQLKAKIKIPKKLIITIIIIKNFHATLKSKKVKV